MDSSLWRRKKCTPLLPSFSFIYANNEPKSALARDLDNYRNNKGKLAKRVFTCFPDRLFLSSGSLHSRKYFPTALS